MVWEIDIVRLWRQHVQMKTTIARDLRIIFAKLDAWSSNGDKVRAIRVGGSGWRRRVNNFPDASPLFSRLFGRLRALEPQRIVAALLPRRWVEAMDVDSRHWMVQCPCGFARSVWELGGIRSKAAGSTNWFAKCPQCGQRSWRSVSRDKPPAEPYKL